MALLTGRRVALMLGAISTDSIDRNWVVRIPVGLNEQFQVLPLPSRRVVIFLRTESRLSGAGLDEQANEEQAQQQQARQWLSLRCRRWTGQARHADRLYGCAKRRNRLDQEEDLARQLAGHRNGALLSIGRGRIDQLRGRSKAFEELGRRKVLSKICWTEPTLSDGRIFARNDKGRLICLAPRR
jgi:hypothetical protein